MIRRDTRPRPGYQQAVSLPVVALADVINGWWHGVARICSECGGRLLVDPPVLEGGRIYCQDCSRETAEVVQKLRPAFNIAAVPPEKRGRPLKSQVIPVDRLCLSCRGRRIAHGRRRCEACAEALRPPSDFYIRLVAALEDTAEPLLSREIASLIGCAPDTVRHLLQQARLRGVPVVAEGRRYWIVEVAA